MKVFVPLVLNQKPGSAPETLHHVAPGAGKCSVCGASKHAQGFYYTEEAEFFDKYARDAGTFGMWSPKHESISPFRACTPHSETQTPTSDSFFLSNGTTVLQ